MDTAAKATRNSVCRRSEHSEVTVQIDTATPIVRVDEQNRIIIMKAIKARR